MAIPRAGTELAIEESAPLDAITSRVIYTSDFGDLPLGINGTEDPGYDTQVGVLLPGSLLGVRGHRHAGVLGLRARPLAGRSFTLPIDDKRLVALREQTAVGRPDVGSRRTIAIAEEVGGREVAKIVIARNVINGCGEVNPPRNR